MRLFLLLFIGFSFISGCRISSDPITVGKVDHIYSNILDEKRELWIYVPERSILSSERFNVVYLLDGRSHFYSVMGLIHQMSGVNGNNICPNMIIVGIRNTDRTRDLTPSHVTSSLFLDTDAVKSSGGGDAFIKFMEDELVPFIDDKYPTSAHRILIGHSFGGLTVINTLLHKPELFTSYLAIDPSMWWDEQKLLKKSKGLLKNKKLKDKSLFLAVANTMTPSMDTSEVRRDTTSTSLHFRSNLQFADILENNNSGLNFQWKYYKDETHSSVPLIAEYDALRFFFNHPINPHEDETIKTDSIIAMKGKALSR